MFQYFGSMEIDQEAENIFLKISLKISARFCKKFISSKYKPKLTHNKASFCSLVATNEQKTG